MAASGWIPLAFVALALLPVAAPASPPAQDAAHVWANGPQLGGPSLVQADAPATFTGVFRTGVGVAGVDLTTSGIANGGRTVFLDVDGQRAATTIAVENSFSFTILLPRGDHALRAYSENDDGGWPTAALGEFFTTAAGRPSVPTSVSLAGGPQWDEARLSWGLPVEHDGAPLHYAVQTSPTATVLGEPTNTFASILVLPGDAVSARVAACNAWECGPSSEPLSFSQGAAPPMDAITARIAMVDVCAGTDRSDGCQSMGPNGTLVVDWPQLTLDLWTSGGVYLDEDAVPSIAVRVETSRDGGALTHDRPITDPEGHYWSVTQLAGSATLASGECRTFAVQARAWYPGLESVTDGRPRVCRP